MAETRDSFKNRLLPSLLDRLRDDEPGQQTEKIEKQVLSKDAFLKTVRRDLQWLFNATSFESQQNLDGFACMDHHNVLKESVLNFGIQDFCGHTASSIEISEIRSRMHLAMLHFEPRIVPSSLKIDVKFSGQFNPKALSFDIRGDLWMQPSPLAQHWKTDVDLETGSVNVEGAVEMRGD